MSQVGAAQPNPGRRPYLGMRAGDLESRWYARYWQPRMAPLPDEMKDGLWVSPVAAARGLEFEEAPALGEPGYLDLENGYVLRDDGGFFFAHRTEMPNVAPKMWDWWFAWHTAEAQRYKLWHPQAHLYVERYATRAVAPTASDRERYIDITAFIDEYVGSGIGRMAVQYRPPAEFGFAGDAFADPDEATAICAIVGLSEARVDYGYMVHHVRRVPGGSEMRSRMWIGGKFVAARDGVALTRDEQGAAEGLTRQTDAAARAVSVHSSQEMCHLAAFLPALYREFVERGSAY